MRRLRRFYWKRIRRYRYEMCQRCGRPVGKSCPSWWSADDALWLEVEGGQGEGIRCIPCFTDDARAKGVSIFWRPVVEARLNAVGKWRPVR